MAWVVPTQQDVLNRWNDAENSKFTTLLHSTQNPLPGTMAGVVEEIRSAIGSRYVLDAPGTIDSSCVQAFVAIVRYRTINNLAGQMVQTDERVQEYNDAVAFLDKIREGKVSISAPVTPQIPGQSSGSPAVLPYCSPWTLWGEAGI